MKHLSTTKRHQRANALVIAVLGLLLLVAAFAAGHLHAQARAQRAQQDALDEQTRRHHQTIEFMRAQVAKTTQALELKTRELESILSQQQKAANEAHQTHVDAVRAGTVGVRVPIVPASCQPADVQPAASAAAAAQPAYAQLDPAAAADLAAIPHEGDAAIRELNTCIAQYNAVAQAMAAHQATLQKAADAQTD